MQKCHHASAAGQLLRTDSSADPLIVVPMQPFEVKAARILMEMEVARARYDLLVLSNQVERAKTACLLASLGF